jgi:hypothetical protein
MRAARLKRQTDTKKNRSSRVGPGDAGSMPREAKDLPPDSVETASDESFPASDPPGWICCKANPVLGEKSDPQS